MSIPEIFSAPSPKDGVMKDWEALSELGTNNPYSFVSNEVGDDEEYNPEDEGYETLLVFYKARYPNS